MPDRHARFTAAQLRAEFDGAFTRGHPLEAPSELDLLVIHVSSQPYALSLSDVVALHAERRLTEAPSSERELLGLVGLRGVVAPVYDLHALLGYPALQTPRWFAQVNAPAPFVLAFEQFEGHVRVLAQALAPVRPGAGATHDFVRGSVTTPEGVLTLLDLRAIFENLRHGRRASAAPERREERP